VELEFFVPEPDETPKVPPKVDKAIEGDAAQLDAALEITIPPPQLEVEVPQKILPSQNEVRMASRALDDPDAQSVLLQGMLGKLPGVNSGRAADMAFNADMALNNLGVRAKRMADLERRKERRAKRGKH
jgi:hypothetical protein